MEKGMEKGMEIGQRELLLNQIESGLKTRHPDSVDEIMDIVKNTSAFDRLRGLPELIWSGEPIEKIRDSISTE